MSQCTPDTHDSPALTRRSPREPTQNRMAGVTALWHLEKKPPIPMVKATGRMTQTFRLERRVHLHDSTRDEALTPLWMPQSNRRSMSALERKPEVLASTPDQDLGPGSHCRGMPRGPSLLAWRLDLPEPHERVLEVPIITRKQPRATRDKSGDSPLNTS